jgi:hypothetical protein
VAWPPPISVLCVYVCVRFLILQVDLEDHERDLQAMLSLAKR